MSLPKDYSSCPPKKRPINFSQYQDCENTENEEPEDLSLKTRQRLLDCNPIQNAPQEPPKKICLSVPQKLPLHILCNTPPTRISTASLIQNKPPQTPREAPKYFANNEGLHLISEVAARVGEMHTPTSRLSAEMISNSIKKSGMYPAPPTPRSPVRIAFREKSSSWSYHPYLPLSVYGLPSSRYSLSVGSTKHFKDTVKESPRPRSGSTSPPGEGSTEISSSGSEGSPELREERLSCGDCGRGYATVAGLSRHQQFHCPKDANRRYECTHCSKNYTTMGALKMHIRTHTLPCKCHICGKAFSRPWLLQGHIRTHTGEKPFECHQCRRSFADRSNLRAHLQTHADVKKYACSSCPKTFSRMSLLLKHQDHGCPGMIGSRPFSITTISAPSPI